jgi:hypothetical protein
MGALAVNAQKTPVKVTDLQKAITDNIAKDYVGFTIKEATKVVEKTDTTFNVVVVKGTTQETLCYDSKGKFLKKMEAKAGTSACKELIASRLLNNLKKAVSIWRQPFYLSQFPSLPVFSNQEFISFRNIGNLHVKSIILNSFSGTQCYCSKQNSLRYWSGINKTTR